MDRGEALERLQGLVGQDLRRIADGYHQSVTVWKDGKLNKGWAGHTIERYLGIPINSSRSPNLGSWELKVVPLTRRADGHLVLKETMAITMLDPNEVLERAFQESHLYTKLRKIIAVSRIREDSKESRSICEHVHAFDLEETTLYDVVAQDYEEIRTTIKERGFHSLTGKMGVYIQPRTKGAGHGSTSRAFYARKEFVEYITGRKSSPRAIVLLDVSDCPRHAGRANEPNRARVEGRMAHLPANQSGAGRHKCPYCAYEEGYRQALVDASTAVERLRA